MSTDTQRYQSWRRCKIINSDLLGYRFTLWFMNRAQKKERNKKKKKKDFAFTRYYRLAVPDLRVTMKRMSQDRTHVIFYCSLANWPIIARLVYQLTLLSLPWVLLPLLLVGYLEFDTSDRPPSTELQHREVRWECEGEKDVPLPFVFVYFAL